MTSLNEHTLQLSPTSPTSTAFTSTPCRSIRIVTFNIGMTGIEKWSKSYGGITNALSQLHGDIICLQEVKLLRVNEQYAKVQGWHGFFSLPKKTKRPYSGVVIYCRSDIATPLASCVGDDDEGRCVITDHGAFVLINVYVPCAYDDQNRYEYKLAFLHHLQARCMALRRNGRHVIVVGDMNITLSNADRHNDTAISHSVNEYDREGSNLSRLWMQSWLHDDGFVDVWRSLHPTERKWTHWNVYTSAKRADCGSRIDYIIADSLVASSAISCSIVSDGGSDKGDHCPVVACFNVAIESASCPPLSCASLSPRFRGTQTSLHSYFEAKHTDEKEVEVEEQSVVSTSFNNVVSDLSNIGSKIYLRGIKKKGNDKAGKAPKQRSITKFFAKESSTILPAEFKSNEPIPLSSQRPDPGINALSSMMRHRAMPFGKPPLCKGHRKPCELKKTTNKDGTKPPGTPYWACKLRTDIKCGFHSWAKWEAFND